MENNVAFNWRLDLGGQGGKSPLQGSPEGDWEVLRDGLHGPTSPSPIHQCWLRGAVGTAKSGMG